MHQHACRTLGAFALAAACGLAALACAGCTAERDSPPAEAASLEASEDTVEGRTLLLPDWYFNNTSDEDVIEVRLNAGSTSAERSGDCFAVTMTEAYAAAFVSGMHDEVLDIVEELSSEAAACGATLEADGDFAVITLTMPAEVYATETGANLALDAKAAAAAAYVYRSAADLGACETVVVDEQGVELSRATLPDDHEELLNAAEQ